MRVLSQRRNEPEKASRPFDKDRDGIVPGEGSAMLVLESLAHAKRRNARVYAEILGYDVGSDARHETEPTPETQAQTMRRAISSAGLNPEDIDYINPHATSTPLGDAIETQAIKLAFGEARISNSHQCNEIDDRAYDRSRGSLRGSRVCLEHPGWLDTPYDQLRNSGPRMRSGLRAKSRSSNTREGGALQLIWFWRSKRLHRARTNELRRRDVACYVSTCHVSTLYVSTCYVSTCYVAT